MLVRSLRSRRPSAAFVLAFIALLVAVGGTAVAATTINGADIRNRSIAGFKLKNQSVGTAQLRNLGVQARDIQNGAVNVSKIRRGAVTRSKIAPKAVGTSEIADGAVTGSDVAGASIRRSNLAASARVPSVVVRQSVIAGVLNGASGETTATCAPGEVLVSGGGGPISSPSPGLSLIASRPQPSGSAPTSWQVIVGNQSGATAEFSAYAVCATPS